MGAYRDADGIFRDTKTREPVPLCPCGSNLPLYLGGCPGCYPLSGSDRPRECQHEKVELVRDAGFIWGVRCLNEKCGWAVVIGCLKHQRPTSGACFKCADELVEAEIKCHDKTCDCSCKEHHVSLEGWEKCDQCEFEMDNAMMPEGVA